MDYKELKELITKAEKHEKKIKAKELELEQMRADYEEMTDNITTYLSI